jgi:hypothetical protein
MLHPVDWQIPTYRRILVSFILRRLNLVRLLDPEVEGDVFLRNVGNHLPLHTA